jgi:acylphosphatase
LDAVEQYGAGAVEHVTEHYALEHQAASMGHNSLIVATSDTTLRTAVAPDHAKHAVMIDWFSPPPAGFVIFYHFALPENDREEGALRLVREQLNMIAHSH